MEIEIIKEVVDKLVGQIEPVGESYADERRYENLKKVCELTDLLLSDIDKVIGYKERIEYSMKRSGEYADKFFDRIGIKG